MTMMIIMMMVMMAIMMIVMFTVFMRIWRCCFCCWPVPVPVPELRESKNKLRKGSQWSGCSGLNMLFNTPVYFDRWKGMFSQQKAVKDCTYLQVSAKLQYIKKMLRRSEKGKAHYCKYLRGNLQKCSIMFFNLNPRSAMPNDLFLGTWHFSDRNRASTACGFASSSQSSHSWKFLVKNRNWNE